MAYLPLAVATPRLRPPCVNSTGSPHKGIPYERTHRDDHWRRTLGRALSHRRTMLNRFLGALRTVAIVVGGFLFLIIAIPVMTCVAFVAWLVGLVRSPGR